MTARTKPTTAEQTLRALEREALEDADRRTALMHIPYSGSAVMNLPDGSTLWVTADRSVLKGRRRIWAGDVPVGRNLAYVPGYSFWLEDGEHSDGLWRAQVLALLEAGE